MNVTPSKRRTLSKLALLVLASLTFLGIALVGGTVLFFAIAGVLTVLLPVGDLLITYTVPLSVLCSVVVLGQLLYWERGAPRHILQRVEATEVTQAEYPDLHAAVRMVAQQASAPVPALYVTAREAPLSLTTGFSPGRSHLVVSDGLLDLLDDEELQAVLAHEVSHIKNRDAAILTAVSLPLNAASRTLRLFRGQTDVDRGVTTRTRPMDLFYLIGLVLVFPLSVALQFAVSAFSRLRELTADSGAVTISGNPTALATALTKLDERYDRLPNDDLRTTVESSFSILNGKTTRYDSAWKRALFATHPTVSKRIDRIRERMRET